MNDSSNAHVGRKVSIWNCAVPSVQEVESSPVDSRRILYPWGLIHAEMLFLGPVCSIITHGLHGVLDRRICYRRVQIHISQDTGPLGCLKLPRSLPTPKKSFGLIYCTLVIGFCLERPVRYCTVLYMSSRNQAENKKVQYSTAPELPKKEPKPVYSIALLYCWLL